MNDTLLQQYMSFCLSPTHQTELWGDRLECLRPYNLEDNIAKWVWLNAYLWAGVDLSHNAGDNLRFVESYAQQIAEKYTQNTSKYLSVVDAAVVSPEKYLRHSQGAVERYTKAMTQARSHLAKLATSHTVVAVAPLSAKQIRATTQRRMALHQAKAAAWMAMAETIVTPSSFPAVNKAAVFEQVRGEEVAVFLAAQHAKLDKMGVADPCALDSLARFAANTEALTLAERIFHGWKAHGCLKNQENVLWEAFVVDKGFTELPRVSSATNPPDWETVHRRREMNDLHNAYVRSYMAALSDISHLYEDEQDPMEVFQSVKSKFKDAPTFFASKNEYLQIYQHALVLEAVKSCGEANLTIDIPVMVSSSSMVKQSKFQP